MKLLTTLTAAFLLTTLSHGQAPLQNAMFTAATSAEDAQGDDWAFLLFQLTSDLETLIGRRLAVYQKPGGIDAPGVFTHTGNVALQDNPAIIKVLLTRSEAIGQPAGNLNLAINELFGELIPDPTIPVEDKLSAVIRGSIGDERQFANLMLLARMHPGVSLALGLAHAQKIGPGTTTFEIRETNLDGAEFGVVGRVSVTAKAPIVLIAPSPPVDVPEYSPMGHLNARLRWAIPDDLRRLSLLQYGFNVYGVDKAHAESLNWHNAPPAPGLLAAASTAFDEVRKINRSPVLPVAIFDEIQALDLAADPKTFFVADDGGLSTADPKPYKDGDRVYYFVTARDVLGRDGFTSPGTEVVLHDRVPPNAPRRPEVTNVVDYIGDPKTEDHRLRVNWRQMVPTQEDPITGYYIYRWANVTDVQKFGADPTHNRISDFIPHLPGETELAYIDNEHPLSPKAPADHDKTYWYTVRAFKPTEDGGVLSPNSAPAFGVLRNRFAPEAPDGKILISCCSATVEPDRVEDAPDASADDPLRAIFEAVCTRKNTIVAWAEFAVNDVNDPVAYLGRFHFQFPKKTVRARIDAGRAQVDDESIKILCRVGDQKGNISPWVELTERNAPQVGSVRRYYFEADEDCQVVELSAPTLAAAPGCTTHSPGGFEIPEFPLAPIDGDSPVKPIIVELGLKEFAREYRVYRRVDEGEMTLWRQGLTDEAQAEKIVLEDGGLPPNAGEVAYFGQYLDDNGNASELKLLGSHVAVAQPGPQPMLSPPIIDGDDDSPRMKIRWFSPPHGVERFAVLLASDPGPLPNSISPLLSTNQEAPQAKIEFTDANVVPKPITFASYHTPSIDSGFGPGPDYELSIPVHKGRKYKVQILAIAKSNGLSRTSQAFAFEWPAETIEEATGPNVPWPARQFPNTLSSTVIADDLAAIRVTTSDFDGLGLIIGNVPANRVVNISGNGHFIDTGDDPRSYLFPEELANDHTLLPMVVYRYQVPSEQFPNPSGDLIQVTPMMTDIATASNAAVRLVRDPFVKLIPPDPSNSQPGDPWRIVLLDTQPAILFARYTYLIVAFNPDGEIRATYTVPSLLLEPTPQ